MQMPTADSEPANLVRSESSGQIRPTIVGAPDTRLAGGESARQFAL
jgi:hypothetical protein